MTSESEDAVLTAAIELLNTKTPLLKMPGAEKSKEFQRLAPKVMELKRAAQRMLAGFWSEEQYRALIPWPDVPAKPDLRSDELRELEKEMDALQAKYDEEKRIYDACVAEENKNPSRASYMVGDGRAVTTEIRDPREAQRKIETARRGLEDTGELLSAARARYYDRAKAEERLRQEREYRAGVEAQLAKQAEQKAARKQSFAADALKFFGIRA